MYATRGTSTGVPMEMEQAGVARKSSKQCQVYSVLTP
jgi:hypothetical protein